MIWNPIESAPMDGTPVKTGCISKHAGAGLVSYPLTSRFLNGEWCANFGSKEAEKWAPYEPQPDVWCPQHPTSEGDAENSDE